MPARTLASTHHPLANHASTAFLTYTIGTIFSLNDEALRGFLGGITDEASNRKTSYSDSDLVSQQILALRSTVVKVGNDRTSGELLEDEDPEDRSEVLIRKMPDSPDIRDSRSSD